MPLLFGILAALGAFAVARGAAAQDRALVLLRSPMPFGGALVPGSVVSLLAQVAALNDTRPPYAFKVRLVGTPATPDGVYTAVFLADTLGARAGEFLEFTHDKIQNVEP